MDVLRHVYEGDQRKGMPIHCTVDTAAKLLTPIVVGQEGRATVAREGQFAGNGRARYSAVPVCNAWCGSSRFGTSTYEARAASCPVAPEPLRLILCNANIKPARRTVVS